MRTAIAVAQAPRRIRWKLQSARDAWIRVAGHAAPSGEQEGDGVSFA